MHIRAAEIVDRIPAAQSLFFASGHNLQSGLHAFSPNWQVKKHDVDYRFVDDKLTMNMKTMPIRQFGFTLVLSSR
jgi:hypothetical protein